MGELVLRELTHSLTIRGQGSARFQAANCEFERQQEANSNYSPHSSPGMLNFEF